MNKESLQQLCDNLNHTLIDSNKVMKQHALKLGYEPSDFAVSDTSIIVTIPEPHNKFNNAIYILHYNEQQEFVLEVLKVNTIDKTQRITELSGYLTNQYITLDTAGLDIYDICEVYGQAIVSSLLRPMGKQLFPEEKYGEELFINKMLPRILSHMARIYLGDEHLREEAINAEPYIIKAIVSDEIEKLKAGGSDENMEQKS